MLEHHDHPQEDHHWWNVHILYPLKNLNFIALTGFTVFRLVIKRESKEGIVSLAPSSNSCKLYHCPSPYCDHWAHKNDSRVEHSDGQLWLPLKINLGGFNACLFPGPYPLPIQLNLHFSGWDFELHIWFLKASKEILTHSQYWEAQTQGTQNTGN